MRFVRLAGEMVWCLLCICFCAVLVLLVPSSAWAGSTGLHSGSGSSSLSAGLSGPLSADHDNYDAWPQTPQNGDRFKDRHGTCYAYDASQEGGTWVWSECVGDEPTENVEPTPTPTPTVTETVTATPAPSTEGTEANPTIVRMDNESTSAALLAACLLVVCAGSIAVSTWMD